MKYKTPQEKKALSYAKDCRNAYGESDKGSRKNIRLNKTVQNRIYRKNVNQSLNEIDNTELENAERVESEVRSVPKGNWKKSSDVPLEIFVELRKDMKERRVGRKMRGTLKKSNLSQETLNKLRERR